MKYLLLLPVLLVFLRAQPDTAYEAYKAWDAQHSAANYKAQMQSLFVVSAEWVAKWPDSKLAWDLRRQSLLGINNHSAELWKQVGENLIRLTPPHTIASSVGYDWVTARVNVEEAEGLLISEIQWDDGRPKFQSSSEPTLADLIDEANFNSRAFGPLCTLASAQIQLRHFAGAHTTIERLHAWLDGDFKRYYDQDPFEAFPDYQSKYFIRSAQLARAEERNTDALAFYQSVVTNPYFHRAYGNYLYSGETHALWKQTGGTEEGWTVFSRVPSLPAGVPKAHEGVSYEPWLSLRYKLPELNEPGLDSRIWTTRDFEGKSTIVYLWVTSCGPLCWSNLPAIQALYNKIKDRPDLQVVTLSVDEDRQTVSTFMKEKGYTFPVMVGKSYAKRLLPQMILGQYWIVDATGAIRLQRTYNNFAGAEQAF